MTVTLDLPNIPRVPRATNPRGNIGGFTRGLPPPNRDIIFYDVLVRGLRTIPDDILARLHWMFGEITHRLASTHQGAINRENFNVRTYLGSFTDEMARIVHMAEQAYGVDCTFTVRAKKKFEREEEAA